jgi:hypothetical protein
MLHHKYILFCLLLLLALLVFYCTDNKIAGNTSELDNPVILGSLYNSDSAKAAGAIVHIRPDKTLADTSQNNSGLITGDTMTVFANSKGQYHFDSIGVGDYVIEATDGNNNLVLIDSVNIADPHSSDTIPPDTLKPAGAIKGIIYLSEGDDPRKVFILAFGLDRYVLPDAQGRFNFTKLARGAYVLRILPALNDYGVFDTTGVQVSAGDTTNLDTISLPFKGIPSPKGFILSYDTLNQTVLLSWKAMDTSLIDGFNIYRATSGQNFSLLTQTPLLDTTLLFKDQTIGIGTFYEYRVVARRSSGEESRLIDLPNDTIRPVSRSLVTMTLKKTFGNTISDSASINDTILFCLNYSNPTRTISQMAWSIDSLTNIVKTARDSSLTGNDTLAYFWKKPGLHSINIQVTDNAGTVWNDSFRIRIVQDIPGVTIQGAATVPINTSISLNAQVYQAFGSIVAYRWDNGITPGFDDSTGSSLSFKYLAEGSYIVKLEVMDDDSNTAIATKTISVTNDAPIITGLKDTTISINDTVSFAVNTTDNNGIIQRYYWYFGDGNAKQDDTTTTPIISHAFPATAMRCSVNVTVADSFGKLACKSAVVNVVVDAPVANAGRDTTVSIKDTVRLHGIATQMFGTITKWEWDIGNTKTFTTVSSGDTEIIVSSMENANYRCVLRITDDDRNQNNDTMIIHIVLDPPLPVITGPDSVRVDSMYVLSSIQSSPGNFGTIKNVEWSIGSDSVFIYNSRVLSLQAPSIENDSFLIVLRITDDDDNISMSRKNIRFFKKWEYLGIPALSSGAASSLRLKVHNDTPYIAWTGDAINGGKANVMRFAGNTWETVGTPDFSQGKAGGIDLAIDNGSPIVVYRDYAYNEKASSMRYNGNEWIPVGNLGFSQTRINDPSFAIENGILYMAHSNILLRFDNNTWTNENDCGLGGEHVSLAVKNGIPYIAFKDFENGDKISVLRYNGDTCEPVGNRGFSLGETDVFSLCINNDTLYVAYTDLGFSLRASVMRLVGNIWQPVGNQGFSPPTVCSISMSFLNGIPYVAIGGNGTNGPNATVMRLKGNTWVNVGPNSISKTQASYISIDFRKGTPCIAFGDVFLGGKITVMEYK